MFEVDAIGTRITYKAFKFSGGEIQVKLDDAETASNSRYIKITARLKSSDDIMELILLVDAIRRSGSGFPQAIDLICPYLPYARQDRVMTPGESLSLRVMCELINNLNFNSVEVWDAHSEVALALLNRSRNVHQSEFVLEAADEAELLGGKVIVVAPDSGALKKVLGVAKRLDTTYIRADKTRDVKTGAITGTVVYSDPVGDQNLMIVDDICDGGRTFIELAKVLRPLTTGKIFLYVTHGIFSQGLDVFNGLIDHIYTANLFNDDFAFDERVTLL